MNSPLPLPELLNGWLRWAEWVSDPDRHAGRSSEMIGWNEFNWAVHDYPELAWQAILDALGQPRMKPYHGVLAAGPLEDLLSLHGERFIERVESEAKRSPEFAQLLGGVWQHTIPEDIWARVQSVWDRSEWDGVQRTNV